METLKELHIINNWIGLVHTLFSILAMLFGGIVVLRKKGTQKHRIFGYGYVVSMFLLNGTAFGIYNFGRLSMFHFFALVSLITVILGIVPTIKRKGNWLKKHFTFMSWSVVGLYCAFWAEIGVRFFDMKYFWWVVMLATIGTSILGAFIINKVGAKLDVHIKNND